MRHRKIHTITLVNVQDIRICLPRSSLSVMNILILRTYSKVRILLCVIRSSLRSVSILTCIRHRKIHTITLVNVQDIRICLPRSSLSVMNIRILRTYSKVRILLCRCYVPKSPYITDDHIHPKPVRAMSITYYSLLLHKLLHKAPTNI